MRQEVVVAFGGRFERELQEAGVAVHRLPSPRASRPLMVWRGETRLQRDVQAKAAPEVAIFHSAWPHAMFASTAPRRGRPHRLRAAHAGHDARVAGSLGAIRAPGLHGVQQPVHAGAAGVSRRARPRDPLCGRQPPAIDPDVRRSLRASLGAGDDDIVVLMAARLERWKGHDVLIEAAKQLPDDARIHIWIAGADREAGARVTSATCTAGASVTGGSRVSLLGDRDDVPTLMRLADIYCQPNLKGEPFGIAIAEAMLASLPCVFPPRAALRNFWMTRAV